MSQSDIQVLVVVNDPTDLKTNSTTADLIRLSGRRGWEVRLAGVRGFQQNHRGGAVVTCVDPNTGTRGERRLMTFDLVLSRTNPARDEPRNALAHRFAMRLLARVADDDVPVINHPAGLERADSKAFLLDLSPSDRPPMIVAQEVLPILRFIDGLEGEAVVKPAHGTHGTGVIRLVSRASGRRQILESLLERGPVVVQPFLTAAAEQGDTRVLLADGAPLVVQDRVCAVRRIPANGDFRSNVAAGGIPAKANVTPRMRQVIERVGPTLSKLGLWLVGLDFVGDRIIEVNAYSPGGLADASRLEGVDFGEALFDRLQRQFFREAA